MSHKIRVNVPKQEQKTILSNVRAQHKYENLDSSFIFVPFGVETLGPWGPDARALFKELSKRVIESTGDPRAVTLASELVWPSKGAMLPAFKELCLAAVVSRTF
ncbi:jg16171 [Pararge aegeria aegeria]|uniref:Jg16171 protein n=1 Tax=Pararge aegeria aegeria TaxID=348720 RepID=A0A8S4RCZ0_9NEOP|nr:jg16171 [Pararge aegeria aegeria]